MELKFIVDHSSILGTIITPWGKLRAKNDKNGPKIALFFFDIFRIYSLKIFAGGGWIGQILRHDSLLRDIIEGRMKGKVTRGRKWVQMLSDVISKSYVQLKREVEDRS